MLILKEQNVFCFISFIAFTWKTRPKSFAPRPRANNNTSIQVKKAYLVSRIFKHMETYANKLKYKMICATYNGLAGSIGF